MLHYIDGDLAAVGVLDVLDTLVISCQLMYHQKYRALSLGKLSILREIEWARQMARKGRGLTHYSMQEYSVNWKKFKYKVEKEGTELLCPHSLKWVPFRKEKTLGMLKRRDNNLGEMAREEMEERVGGIEEWVEKEERLIMDKVMLANGLNLVSLWPHLVYPE